MAHFGEQVKRQTRGLKIILRLGDKEKMRQECDRLVDPFRVGPATKNERLQLGGSVIFHQLPPLDDYELYCVTWQVAASTQVTSDL